VGKEPASIATDAIETYVSESPISLEGNVESSVLSLRDTIKGGAMKSLISLIYASRSTEHFHEHEIPDLLQQVRIANAKQEFTGMLLYIGGSFLQVLEGQPEMVDAAFSKILKDKRHTQITLIANESIPERAFEGWTMMHKTLDPVEAGELIGEIDYFTSPTWLTQLDVSRAKKLLLAASLRWQMEHRTGKYRTLGGRTA
jgi:Sensors of blue-light using FAD